MRNVLHDLESQALLEQTFPFDSGYADPDGLNVRFALLSVSCCTRVRGEDEGHRINRESARYAP